MPVDSCKVICKLSGLKEAISSHILDFDVSVNAQSSVTRVLFARSLVDGVGGCVI